MKQGLFGLGFESLQDLGDNADPVTPENEDLTPEPLTLAVDPYSCDLVAVDDLPEDQPGLQAPILPDPSLEGLGMGEGYDIPTEVEMKGGVSTQSVEKMRKIYASVGLEYQDGPPKPPPSIYIHDGVAYIYLGGICYPTVAPLLHILSNAEEGDRFVIEINYPYIHPDMIMSIVSAIDSCKGDVTTNISAADSIATLMLGISGKTFNLLPSVHILKLSRMFGTGSGEEIAQTAEHVKRHNKIILDYLKERKVITDEEYTSLYKSNSIVHLSSDEIMKRMGVESTSQPTPDPAPSDNVE